MKNLLFFLCFFALSASGAVVNGIAIVVNNEPITLYEIDEAMKSLNLSRERAIEALIADRIERAQIKKMGALVDEFELENEIKKLLAANEQSEDAFKMELASKGTSWDDFKKDFRKELEKRKLYEAVAGSAKVDYSEEGARNYYEINQDSFKLYENISANAYTSTNSSDLENLIAAKNAELQSAINLSVNSGGVGSDGSKNAAAGNSSGKNSAANSSSSKNAAGNSSGKNSAGKAGNSSGAKNAGKNSAKSPANLLKNKRIKSENLVLTMQNADPRLLVYLSGIEENGFSPVLENGDSFIVYEVKSRAKPQTLPYEEIKEQVAQVYINKQRQDFMKDFFDKLYSKANVVRVR